MDLSSFIKVLSRHKYTLIIVPIVAVIVTYFLVRNQPDTYLSSTLMSTGIVDQTQQGVGSSAANAVLQDTRIQQEFNNLLAMIKSKKVVDQLSYKLMMHDLTSATPYRKPSKLFSSLGTSAKAHALEVYNKLYQNHESLSLFNADQRGLHDLLVSMKYDDQSLLQKLSVYRSDNSDYLYVQFESDNPDLSALAVNSLCEEFINYYATLIKGNQQRSVTFYSELVKAKNDTLQKLLNKLKDYKIKNRVLSLTEQSKSLYAQLSDFETRLQQNEKDAIAYKAALNDIDNQFNPADRKYAESSMVRINQNLAGTQSQLEALNNEYVQSGFKPGYTARIDSLNRVLSTQIGQASDKYINNPMVAKQSLIQQKLALQVQYDLAKNSTGSIRNEIGMINQRLTGLVPHEAIVQAQESAIQLARDEYLEVLYKYNQSRFDSNTLVHLKQSEMAMPGGAQPSKKMLLVIISGVVSFIFCIVVFFILFYFDSSVKTPADLANATKTDVLGYLHKLNGSTLDLRQIWTDTHSNEDERQFKNLMQSIRYEIDTDLKNDKILLINSLVQGEGKTFLTLNLAYAYSFINKKVLLIDGDFTSPDITKAVKPNAYLEDFLSGQIQADQITSVSKISVLGNRGNDGSLMQIASEHEIRQKFDYLKTIFDIIIVEAPGLNTLNKSKEWVTVADKIVTVFKAGKGLKEYHKAQVSYLKSLPGQYMGWILNETDPKQLPAEELA
ncbi:lipopolysaccharide biosynthesis protein [Mucilaginibacter sp. CSA2-8R]|uniref:GumC family protein n=1 Tax=Mucilaginibacter sp. CSA2-8R TaxID=3141542 RepID=UPI00315DC7DF